MAGERKPLPIEFYQRPSVELAPLLLGCLLVKETDEGTASGFIVETEAYMGAEDGRRTASATGARNGRKLCSMRRAAFIHTSCTLIH